MSTPPDEELDGTRDGVPEPAAEAAPTVADAGNGMAPISDSAVADDASALPDSSDRRSYPRRKRLLRVQVIDVLKNSEAFSGWVVDRSVGGMCISVDHEIEPGTPLKVRPTNVPASAPWVELRVQSIRPQDGTWDLGCAFLRTPTWEVLLQFG